MAAHAGRSRTRTRPAAGAIPVMGLRHTEPMCALHAPALSDGEVGVRSLAPAELPAPIEACRDLEISRWTRVPFPYLREDAERFLAISATEAAAAEGNPPAATDPPRAPPTAP